MITGPKPMPVTRGHLVPVETAPALGGNGGPSIAPIIPDKPDFLDGEASAEWDRVAGELADLDYLERCDRAALAMYCCAFARWREAEEALTRSATLLTATKTGYVYPNPLIAIANNAMRTAVSLAQEFGMTPAMRSRMKRLADDRQGELFDDLDRHLAAGRG